MKSSYVTVACVLGFAGVALGAFGAHALASITTANRLETWSTAVDYHLFHTLAILASQRCLAAKPLFGCSEHCLRLPQGFLSSRQLICTCDYRLGHSGCYHPIGGVLLCWAGVCLRRVA